LLITAGLFDSVCNILLHLFTIDEAMLLIGECAFYPKFAVKLVYDRTTDPQDAGNPDLSGQMPAFQ
jgi:hypothetical protein